MDVAALAVQSAVPADAGAAMAEGHAAAFVPTAALAAKSKELATEGGTSVA